MTISSFRPFYSSLFFASLLSFGAVAQAPEGDVATPNETPAEAAAAPSEAVPAETPTEETPAPAEAAPAEAAPAEAAPAEAAPAEAAPAEAAPAEAAPAEAAPAEAAPAEAAPAEAAPAEAAPMGSVSVSSTPAGEIFLDGEPLQRTTPAMDIPVAPGTHTLRVVDSASGMEKTVNFDIEGATSLQLELELEPMAPAAASEVAEAAAPEADWNWMTVAGWGSLGLGTMGLVSGAVVLTTPYDPDQETLGFGLFGAGAGMILGGGVLLYLDGEMADQNGAEQLSPDAEAQPSAMLPRLQPLARRSSGAQ